MEQKGLGRRAQGVDGGNLAPLTVLRVSDSSTRGTLNTNDGHHDDGSRR